jgi:MraZ protein
MFWGEYSHLLDKKGRLIIPARFRPKLASGTILTRGIDRHLVIYPSETWRSVSEQINQMPITDPTGRALRRLVFSGAVQLTIDRQGRTLIPAYLREYALLDEAVLLVGMENFIELWQPESWRAALDDVSHALAETVSALKLSV